MIEMILGEGAKVNMCLNHEVVTGVPVYESLDIETDNDEGRVAFTRLLCELGGSLYMGCFSIGEHFRLRSIALLKAMCDLEDDEDSRAARKTVELLPRMKPETMARWIDALLDKHEGEPEIELYWEIKKAA